MKAISQNPTTLGSVTEEKVAQDGPPAKGEFIYVDIGSIDIKNKRIVEPTKLRVDKAPSRARQSLKAGDVLVSMTRPNRNAVAIVPNELDGAVGSTGFHVLRARDVEPAWLFHAVQTNDFIDKMCSLVQGALYPAVRPKDIRNYLVPLPPLPDQRRIVAEIENQFTRLDAGVEALRRVQANLKRYHAAVLKAACEGRLVPTEAELAKKRKAKVETGEALLARILSERRKNWTGRGQYQEPTAPDKANLPQNLPVGWGCASIDQITENFDGRRIPLKSADRDKRPGKHPYYGASGIIDDIDDFLFDGDFLLIAEDGANLLTRRTPIAFRATGKFWVNNHAHIVQTRDAIPLAYLSAFLNGKDIAFSVTGSAQPKLTQAALNKIPVPLPPLAEQTRIVAEVERRLSVVDELETVVTANLQRATRLRQSILQQAFSGGTRCKKSGR